MGQLPERELKAGGMERFDFSNMAVTGSAEFGPITPEQEALFRRVASQVPRSDRFCEWKPPPGWQLGRQCPECGHSDLVAIGTGHCPVCELVWQATPQFRMREARRQGGQRSGT